MSSLDAVLFTVSSLGDLLRNDNGTTSYMLAVIYICSCVYSVRRFMLLWRRRRQWDAPRLFVFSISFALALRALSFSALSVLAFADIAIAGASGGAASRVLAVIFNLGDWAAISTYLLLIVVWVELLQVTRGHFFQQERLRRDWMIAFLVLNSMLYLLQIGLYACVFLAPVDPDALLKVIYVVVAALNFIVPVFLVCSAAAAHFCLFSGFPFLSPEARRSWEGINRLVASWTAGRLLWAIAAVFSANDLFLNAVKKVGSWLFCVVIVSLFVLAELLPFLASLGTTVLRLFTLQEEFDDEGRRRGQGLLQSFDGVDGVDGDGESGGGSGSGSGALGALLLVAKDDDDVDDVVASINGGVGLGPRALDAVAVTKAGPR